MKELIERMKERQRKEVQSKDVHQTSLETNPKLVSQQHLGQVGEGSEHVTHVTQLLHIQGENKIKDSEALKINNICDKLKLNSVNNTHVFLPDCKHDTKVITPIFKQINLETLLQTKVLVNHPISAISQYKRGGLTTKSTCVTESKSANGPKVSIPEEVPDQGPCVTQESRTV